MPVSAFFVHGMAITHAKNLAEKRLERKPKSETIPRRRAGSAVADSLLIRRDFGVYAPEIRANIAVDL